MNPVIATPTKQIFNGKPYYLCGKYFQNDGERLHRTVYEFHNGPIPKGMAVHHIDENRSNNSIDNLMLMRLGEHTSHHHTGLTDTMPAEALEAAAVWHGSQEGREWHTEHYAKYGHAMQVITDFVCEVCGKDYRAKIRGNNRFCSAKCCAKDRRDSGADSEIRKCEYCAADFSVNRYKPNRFCCRGCSSRFNAIKKKGA